MAFYMYTLFCRVGFDSYVATLLFVFRSVGEIIAVLAQLIERKLINEAKAKSARARKKKEKVN